MLPVGARLAPIDRPGLIADLQAVQTDLLAVALHGQLLKIGRESFEVLVIGQHGHCLSPEEGVVPDGQQPHEHRQVLIEGSGTEVLIHGPETGKHGPEVVRPDGDHGRKADGRIHRIAASDPIPEPEHIGRVDTEFRHLLGIGRDGNEVPGYGLFILKPAQAPGPGGAGVGHGFQGGEGLGRDDKQGLFRVEVERGFSKIRGVHVGDKTKGQIPSAVVLQRFIGHDRTKIGAADTDVDDVTNRFSAVSRPSAAADLV